MTGETGRAIEAYRKLVKIGHQQRLAEEELQALVLGVPQDEMNLYVRLTQEIDQASGALEEALSDGRLAESTKRQYISTYLNNAGRM